MGECSRVHTQRVGVQPLSSVAVSRYWTRKGLGFNLSHDAPGNIALQARVSACRGQVFINARARRSCRRRTDLGQKDIKLPDSSPSTLEVSKESCKKFKYIKNLHTRGQLQLLQELRQLNQLCSARLAELRERINALLATKLAKKTIQDSAVQIYFSKLVYCEVRLTLQAPLCRVRQETDHILK